MDMPREAAETLGLQCLNWLAGNDELLPVFMGATGAAVADFRDRAQDPDFLAAVLEFVLLDDAWVVEFCRTQGLAGDLPRQALAALAGGDGEAWA